MNQQERKDLIKDVFTLIFIIFMVAVAGGLAVRIFINIALG